MMRVSRNISYDRIAHSTRYHGSIELHRNFFRSLPRRYMINYQDVLCSLRERVSHMIFKDWTELTVDVASVRQWNTFSEKYRDRLCRPQHLKGIEIIFCADITCCPGVVITKWNKPLDRRALKPLRI